MPRPLNPNIPTADELRDLYETRGMSHTEIAERLGVSQGTIGNWLKRYGVKSRDFVTRKFPILDRELLRSLFVDGELSISEIADKLEQSDSVIRHNLRHLDLLMDEKELARREARKTQKARPRLFNPSRDELYDLYITQGLSQEKIGEIFGVHQMTVCNRLSEYGIERELIMMSRGYRLSKSPAHPRAHHDGTVKEHLLVAERAIGRYLNDSEEVHHIDLNKLNNQVDNLAVITEADHSKLHRYMERFGAYMAFASANRPAPLDFDSPAFWSGKWVNSIDLTELRTAKAQRALIEHSNSKEDISPLSVN
jgi:transposase